MLKTILYFGNDQDFLAGLQKSSSLFLKSFEVIQCELFTGALIEKVRETNPHLVIVDSTDASFIAEEIRFLKRIKDHKAILWAAICSDQKEADEKAYLLAAGVSLIHVQGTEIQTFLIDCFSIAFGLSKRINMFAEADNLRIKLRTGFLSSIISLTPESLALESDIFFQDSMFLKFNDLADLGVSEFQITKRNDFSYVAPYFHTYKLPFPFPGPWDIVASNSILPETIETWIDLHKEEFDPRLRSLSVFSVSPECITEILTRDVQAFWIDVYQTADEKLPDVVAKNPAAIFFELAKDSPHDLNHLSLLIETIRKECDDNILIVVFNTPSDSDALQKAFDYPSVIGTKDKMKPEIFSMMQSRLLGKLKTEEVSNYFLRLDDPCRVVQIMSEITLTSITEHELTFSSKHEIPLFSVLVFDLPLPFYLTIVTSTPPKSERGISEYCGVIHGIGEEALMKLRKLVNQMIYNPTDELSEEVVKGMLKQDYLIKASKEEVAKTIEIEAERPVVIEAAGRFTINRNEKLRSKL